MSVVLGGSAALRGLFGCPKCFRTRWGVVLGPFRTPRKREEKKSLREAAASQIQTTSVGGPRWGESPPLAPKASPHGRGWPREGGECAAKRWRGSLGRGRGAPEGAARPSAPLLPQTSEEGL